MVLHNHIHFFVLQSNNQSNLEIEPIAINVTIFVNTTQNTEKTHKDSYTDVS